MSTGSVPAVKLVSLSSNMKHQKIINLKKIPNIRRILRQQKYRTRINDTVVILGSLRFDDGNVNDNATNQ